jgi:hypothetical protein
LSEYDEFYYGLSLYKSYNEFNRDILYKITKEYPNVMRYLLIYNKITVNIDNTFLKELIYTLDDVDIFRMYFDRLYNFNKPLMSIKDMILIESLPGDENYEKLLLTKLYVDIVHNRISFEV